MTRWPPVVSFAWLLVKLMLFAVLANQGAEAIVVAYQQF